MDIPDVSTCRAGPTFPTATLAQKYQCNIIPFAAKGTKTSLLLAQLGGTKEDF